MTNRSSILISNWKLGLEKEANIQYLYYTPQPVKHMSYEISFLMN